MDVVPCHKTLVESSIKEGAMVECSFAGRSGYVSDGPRRPSVLEMNFKILLPFQTICSEQNLQDGHQSV